MRYFLRAFPNASREPVLSLDATNLQVVGTWKLMAADQILPDGIRVPDYGTQPGGLAIFTADGLLSAKIQKSHGIIVIAVRRSRRLFRQFSKLVCM
jgi:hypothetical protein